MAPNQRPIERPWPCLFVYMSEEKNKVSPIITRSRVREIIGINTETTNIQNKPKQNKKTRTNAKLNNSRLTNSNNLESTRDSEIMSQDELNDGWARLREEREQLDQRDRELDNMRRDLMTMQEQLNTQRTEQQQAQQEWERRQVEQQNNIHAQLQQQQNLNGPGMVPGPQPPQNEPVEGVHQLNNNGNEDVVNGQNPNLAQQQNQPAPLDDRLVNGLVNHLQYSHIRVNPPIFKDEMNPLDFIEDLDRFFRFKNIQLEGRLVVLDTLFEGKAGKWYRRVRDQFANYEQFKQSFLKEFYSTPFRVQFENRWATRRYTPRDGSLHAYFNQQLHETRHFDPPLTAYKKNYTIVQQLPSRVRGMVSSVNFADTEALSRTLTQIDGSQEDASFFERVREWKPFGKSNEHQNNNPHVNSMQMSSKINGYGQVGGNNHSPCCVKDGSHGPANSNSQAFDFRNNGHNPVVNCNTLTQYSNSQDNQCQWPDVSVPPPSRHRQNQTTDSKSNNYAYPANDMQSRNYLN